MLNALGRRDGEPRSVRFELQDRSDRELLVGVKVLVGREREATAELIAHLSEIDERRLFLAEGCSSLFKYCTEVLHLSEPSAYNRIDVARIARKFPVIFEQLAKGYLHLSAVRILGPCLTRGNHLALLEAAKHKSKDEVERIAVSVRPRPDVPSVIRKLPERAGSESPKDEGSGASLFGGGVAPAARSKAEMVEGSSGEGSELTGRLPEELSGAPGSDALLPASSSLVASVPRTVRGPVVSALSPGRYKIEFTADEETYQAFRKLQGLLAHRLPKGDPPAIFKKALLLLLEEVRREKLAEVRHPRKKRAVGGDLWGEGGGSEPDEQGRGSEPDERARGSELEEQVDRANSQSAKSEAPVDRKRLARESRHIPAVVKRTVWKRDGGRCAFVSQDGRRCSERRRLEFHHVHAYALGGPATVDNIALRCRAHNAHEAHGLFGGDGKKLTRSGASSGTDASSRTEASARKEASLRKEASSKKERATGSGHDSMKDGTSSP